MWSLRRRECRRRFSVFSFCRLFPRPAIVTVVLYSTLTEFLTARKPILEVWYNERQKTAPFRSRKSSYQNLSEIRRPPEKSIDIVSHKHSFRLSYLRSGIYQMHRGNNGRKNIETFQSLDPKNCKLEFFAFRSPPAKFKLIVRAKKTV